jgi:hypothetical protein
MTKLITLLVAAGSLAACKTGGSAEVRADIQQQLASTKPDLDNCYQIALARNRHLNGGFITVEFVAEGGTGQFKNVLIRRDEVQDPAVRMCVIQAVSKLKLTKPVDSNTTIPFPFRFTALN